MEFLSYTASWISFNLDSRKIWFHYFSANQPVISNVSINPFTAIINARNTLGENTAILMLLWCYK